MTGAVVLSICAESEAMAPALLELSSARELCAEHTREDDGAIEEPGMGREEAVLLEESFESAAEEWGADRDLWMYRDRTVGLLRRYARLSVEVGRLPSLLGREFFRAKITSYHVATFEDTVIFVHDVEQGLESLGWFQKKVIAMVILEEFTQEEAARLLQCNPRTVRRYLQESIDALSEVFLRGSILKPLAGHFPNRETACQGGESASFSLTDSKEGKNKC